jgi:hypothetical protein
MALTSTLSLDLVGQVSTLSFYQGASMVDQITYSNNSITYQAITTYNLSQGDLALYFAFLNAFLSSLYSNFPIVSGSANLIWPLSQFDITILSSGVTHLEYTQSSQGNSFLFINFVSAASSGSFSTRLSPVTITNQEFINGISFQKQFFNQVALY